MLKIMSPHLQMDNMYIVDQWLSDIFKSNFGSLFDVNIDRLSIIQ